MSKEKRQFRMHPKLLLDVIQRQAGTLAKAILEGIMNAVDAAATQVTVTCDAETVTITDDGTGFKDRKAIEEFFETFGQPHEEAENKRFGTFRMGRGQLFAFGHNSWRTGTFSMVVDVAKNGSAYDLDSKLPVVAGCTIQIRLYKPLGIVSQREVEDDIARMVKWLSMPVIFNGKQLSKDPAEGKWDDEDEYAYYKFRESNSLDVYNLGVLAEPVYSSKTGCGGMVVSKQQLRLNFARNSVMSDCPIYAQIKRKLDSRAAKDRGKATLTSGQRDHAAKQFLGELITVKEMTGLALFTDVTGRHWKYDGMRNQAHKFRRKITVAPKGDQRGDVLQQQKLAFVLAQETLERFGCETYAEFDKKVMSKLQPSWQGPWAYTPLEEIAESIDDNCTLIPEKEWSSAEQATLATITAGVWDVYYANKDSVQLRTGPRRILLGDGPGTAWTDGVSYIAFTRKALAEFGTTIGGWVRIARVLLHELCHDEVTNGEHGHTPEFYEAFHNDEDTMAIFVTKAIATYPDQAERAGRRLTKEQLRQKEKTDKVTAAGVKPVVEASRRTA